MQHRILAFSPYPALLASLLWLCASAASAASAAMPAPQCWRELAYAAGNTLASASTTLRFETYPRDDSAVRLLEVSGERALQPQGDVVGLLHIDFEAMRSRGSLDVWHDPSTGAVLQSRRIGQGQDARLKTHRFLANGVWRVRRAAAGEARLEEAERWELRSEELLPYPPLAQQEVAPVMVPEMLLTQLAMLASSARTRQANFLVYTDKVLYRVIATAARTKLIESQVQYQLGRDTRVLHGPRPARRVRLEALPIAGQAEDEEFKLFELGGDLSVFIDVETALPLGIEGTWLGFGSVPVALQRARIDVDCGG